MSLPNWLILWIWQSLLGEIYPEIRVIAVGFDANRKLRIRYYLDREPTEDDYENLAVVVANIFAHTSSREDIKEVEEEIVFAKGADYEIDPLDGVVFARKEYTA